ncbi:MAG: alpha/beta hydrolase [Christensenellales bacterium]
MSAIIPKIAFDFDDWFKDWNTNGYKPQLDIKVINDVSYDACEDCTLDLYVPPCKDNEKYMTLINIHGGGWITGDKYKRRGLGLLYADMGLFTVNINYGLCPKYKYHQSVQHCFKALKWVYDNADKYNLDRDKIFVTGDSAGGQLACLLMATQNNVEFRQKMEIEDSPARIKGGVLACGAYDVDAMLKNPMAHDIIKDMTGQTPKNIGQYPYYFAMRTIDLIDKDFPDDVVITYGGYDAFVGGYEIPLARKLEALNKRYFIYRGAFPGDHCYHLYYRRKTSRQFYDLQRDYFDQMRRLGKIETLNAATKR